MMVSGSAGRTKGLGLSFVSERKRLMAALARLVVAMSTTFSGPSTNVRPGGSHSKQRALMCQSPLQRCRLVGPQLRMAVENFIDARNGMPRDGSDLLASGAGIAQRGGGYMSMSLHRKLHRRYADSDPRRT